MGEELALSLLKDADFTPQFEELGFFTASDFIELGQRTGLNRRTCIAVMEAFLGFRDKWTKLLDSSYLSDEKKELYLNHIKDRFLKLERYF